MNVRMPDGTVIENVPENITKAELQAKLKGNGLNYEAMTYAPTVGMSDTAKFFTAAGAGMTDLARGAGQTVGLVDQADIAAAKERDAPLVSSGAGKAGYIAGQVAATSPAAFIPGANTVAGSAAIGGATGLIQPVAEGNVLTGKLKNAAIGAATAGGIQAGMNKLGSMVAGGVEDAAAKRATNAVRDETLRDAQQAGYVVPPTQVKPGWINSLLEGTAGKISTSQKASIKNQQITNNLARAAVRLDPGEQVTKESLTKVRNVAGQAYQELADIKSLGATDEFVSTIQGLGRDYQALVKDVPEMADPQIENLIKALDKPSFSGQTAVALIKRLRFDGNKNAFNPNLGPRANELGKAQLEAAGAIEDLIEANISQLGEDGAKTLQNFRDARTLIAKTYTIEKALNEATGNVSAKKLATQLTKGKPLSGELKTAAEFAQAFPKAAQDVAAGPGVSPLDMALSAGGTAATGNPGFLAWLAGRPAVRSMILSKPYQAFNQPSYEGLPLKTLEFLRANPGINSDTVKQLLRVGPMSIYAAQQQ